MTYNFLTYLDVGGKRMDIKDIRIMLAESLTRKDMDVAVNLQQGRSNITFLSPYPTSPNNIKENKFYIVTQGLLKLKVDENNTYELEQGTIFSLLDINKMDKLSTFNPEYNKHLMTDGLSIYIEVGILNDERKYSELLSVNAQELKLSKCTIEPLDEVCINGVSVPIEFQADGYVHPLSLMMGDVIWECFERHDVRALYKLNNDMIVEVHCQCLDNNNEWVNFDKYLIRPDYSSDYMREVILVDETYEYKDKLLQRLSREIPSSNERKVVCESIFKVAPIDALVASGRDKQELADYIMSSIGYSSAGDLVELSGGGRLTLKELEKLKISDL